MNFETVEIENPEGLNFILGQTHFIKSVQDLYEVCIQSGTALKFGIAFCEASGNDDKLIELAVKNAQKIGCGHTFIIFIQNGYPLNILNAIKMVPEVCRVFCATANPCAVVVAKLGETRRGIMGVLDGIENEQEASERVGFVKMIGYKR